MEMRFYKATGGAMLAAAPEEIHRAQSAVSSTENLLQPELASLPNGF